MYFDTCIAVTSQGFIQMTQIKMEVNEVCKEITQLKKHVGLYSAVQICTIVSVGHINYRGFLQLNWGSSFTLTCYFQK